MELWDWLTGDGASFCDTCRKASIQRKQKPACENCEGRCPDLLPGNKEAFELLELASSQVRFGGMGGVLGYDWNVIRDLAGDFGFDISPALWRKIRAVENVIRENSMSKNKEK